MTSSRITLRNVDPELLRRLRTISAARGESLNRTVLHLHCIFFEMLRA